MPIARKPAEILNYKFMCAMLYIIENSFKWRALPKKYGKWHTVYMKFNRWARNGTIARILTAMIKQKLFNKGDSAPFIDSTDIKMN